jgi:hypothetical protein
VCYHRFTGATQPSWSLPRVDQSREKLAFHSIAHCARRRNSQADLLSPGAGGAGVQHLVTGEAVWGRPPRLLRASDTRQRQATPKDDLIVRVLDVETYCYAISPTRRADRDEAAISTRNRALADAAETVLRAGRPPMPGPGDESPVGWLVPDSGRRNRRRLSGWRGYGAASPTT